MIDIEIYTQKLISECKRIYGERLIYVGLQGSYMVARQVRTVIWIS